MILWHFIYVFGKFNTDTINQTVIGKEFVKLVWAERKLFRATLRRIKPFAPLCALVTLYRSLIEPYFDYCSLLWDICGKQLQDKLQKIQNRAGRVITGSSYDVRSVDVLNNLNWKTLETRRFHTKATLMYKILNDLSAPHQSNSLGISRLI